MTINGAAVHISDKGHIDKGPKELVGKHENEAHSEHHKAQSKLHSAAASAKGPQHADTPLHQKAAAEHSHAAHQYKNAHEYASEGNLNAAKNTRKRAEQHEAKAKEHTEELAKRNPPQAAPKAQAPHQKPAAHAALHSDAEDDVKGSEPHHAEHKRLVQQYNKAGADWERHAINNKISENATAATKTKAESAHKRAINASKEAHESDEPADHQRAKEAIDEAKAAHSKAGRGDDDDKMKELDKLRKPHHAKTLREKTRLKKEAEKATAKSGPGPMSREEHIDTANYHRGVAMSIKSQRRSSGYHAPTREDHEGHEAAAKLHEQAARSGSAEHSAAAEAATRKLGHEPMRGLRKGPGPQHGGKNPYINDPNKPLPKRAPTAAAQNDFRKAHAASGSFLSKIAAKHLKKAAEEAADQDPKHKK